VIPEKLYGIIGHPLGHTMSPLLHNWGFARLGIKAAYLAFPTPPEGLKGLIQAVRSLLVSGLSVTIPHKEAVMPLLDSLDSSAEMVGAVNTLVWEQGRLTGHNTDLAGFLRPLGQLEYVPQEALVLGAGGAAKAVLAGLKELGVGRIYVANRDPGRAEVTAGKYQAQAVPWEDRTQVKARLVVNTTPLGLAGAAQRQSPLPADYWSKGQVAYDLVYNPLKTRFLAEAQAAGTEVIDGLSMFAAQGAAQFELWTGLELPLAEARELLVRALAARD
jgi:shikimate dehydrogenase